MRHNNCLVRWFDRLVATGFVTSIALSKSEHRKSCEFISPVYDNVTDLGAVLTASFSDLMYAAMMLSKVSVPTLTPPSIAHVLKCLQRSIVPRWLKRKFSPFLPPLGNRETQFANAQASDHFSSESLSSRGFYTYQLHF